MKGPRGARFLLLGLVLISTGRSLGNGFAFDDVPIILENAQVHAFSPPWVYAGQSYWPPKNLGDAYRPWTVWWFAIQWAASGGAPAVFHLVNLALTAAVTLAVYGLALALMPPFGAVAAAALFAVHPLHVEATGNVVGQAELWMTLFSVLGALVYLRARRHGAIGAGARWSLAALVVLAGASKEQGVVLPGLLGLVELLAFPGVRWRDRLRLVGPTFGIVGLAAVAFLIGRYAVLGDLGGGPPAAGLERLGIFGRIVVMAPLAVDWARLLVWPASLSAQYSPPAYGGPLNPIQAGLGAGVVIAAVAAGWRAWRRQPALALGLGWIGLAILPVSNGLFPTGVLIAERTLFLPSVGVGLIAGCLFRRPSWLSGGVLVVLLGLGAARSFSRQAVWRDGPTLFAQTIADQPDGYRGFFIFGRELTRMGQSDRAAAMYRRAGDLYSGDHRVFEEWGQVLRASRQCAAAIPIFERGVAAAPAGTVARSRLFECLMTERRFREALVVARTGVGLGSTEFSAAVIRATNALATSRSAPDVP